MRSPLPSQPTRPNAPSFSLTAGNSFLLHWERKKKMPHRPSSPTPLSLLSPRWSLWTLHLGTQPIPCYLPQNMAPASVPSLASPRSSLCTSPTSTTECITSPVSGQPPQGRRSPCSIVARAHRELVASSSQFFTNLPTPLFPAPPCANCPCQGHQ